jgi:hypothetical protein
MKLHKTRKDLEVYFDRLYNFIEVFAVPILVMAIDQLTFSLESSFGPLERIGLFFSNSSAQFSLLKSPNPDDCSKTIQAPFIPYSRAFHFICLQLLYLLYNYLLASSQIHISLTLFNVLFPFHFIILLFLKFF